MYSNVLVLVSQIMKKIKSYAVRLNKDALKNLPSALLQPRGKQYFIVEYFMVFAAHRLRMDH